MRVSIYDSTGALIGGTLERKSKKSAKPLHSRAEIEALIDLLIGGKTQDEGPGHPFHGNQYVQVGGQSLKVPTPCSVKLKLLNLFAQGHKFTLKELAALLGQSEVTLRGRLSEIKKAAPAGGLILEKNGDHYSIKKKEAEAEPAKIDYAAEAQAEWEKYAAAEAKANGEAPTPSPEPVAEPVAPEKAPETPMTLAEKALPELGTFAPPASGPMTTSAADAIYKDKLKAWVSTVQGAKFDEIEPEALDALAQGWKNTKANGMAEWKANTAGISIVTKPQQVFEADKQFVKDVINGDSFDKANLAWKTNTANEKKGLWPVDPEKVAEQLKMAEIAKVNAAVAAKLAGEEYAKKQEEIKAQQVAELKAQEAALADAYKEHGPHFATVPNYAGSGGISADDVIDGTFEKGITELGSKLFTGPTGSFNSEGNKKIVQQALDARLASSKAYQSLVAQRKAQNVYDAYGTFSATLVQAWAGSSGGANPVSNAMQLTIRDAFELKHGDVAYAALDALKSAGSEEHLYHTAAKQLKCAYDTADQKATFRSGLRDFALAQYHNTQEHFKNLGITHVCVARGSGGDVGVLKDSAATHGTVKLQPASSFSTNMSTAHGFSGGDSVYMVKVPVSQVIGSARTGYGCTGECEVVVLAHPKTQAIRVPANKGHYLHDAITHVKNTIKTGPSASSEALAKYEAAKASKQAAAELKMKVMEKVAAPVPVVPKPHNYQLKGAYKAAKYGKVDEAKAELAKYKAAPTSNAGTQAAFEKYVAHAEAVAAHKKASLLAKEQIKAEAKAAAKAAKPAKKTLHVHIHNEPPALPPHLQSLAAKMEASHSHTVTEVTPAGYGPEESTPYPGSEKTPAWFKQHPMHSKIGEHKYWQMVAQGKSEKQIKNYYGSLKHASLKKLNAHTDKVEANA